MMKINIPGKSSCRYECENEPETENIILEAFKPYGEISYKSKKIIHIGTFNYFSTLLTIENKEGRNSKKLTEIKERLKRIQTLSLELSSDLEWIKRNPTIQDAVFKINPARRNENFTTLTETARLLSDPLPSLALEIERKMPDTNKWPEELKPNKELIKMLALAYKEVTGREAKVNYSDADAEYYGKFYDLIVTIFTNMQSLEGFHSKKIPSGNTIRRALP